MIVVNDIEAEFPRPIFTNFVAADLKFQSLTR